MMTMKQAQRKELDKGSLWGANTRRQEVAIGQGLTKY